MKTFFRSCSLLSFLAASLLHLSGCDRGGDDPKAAENKPLIVGTSADNPPFEFQENGEIKGLDIDLMTQLGRKMGREVVLKEMDFNALIPALQAGHIDIIAAALTPTPDRQKSVDFSNTYYQTTMALLSLKSQELKSLEEMPGLKVGAQLGSMWEQFAKERASSIPGLEIIALNRNNQLVEELKLGRIQAVLLEESQARTFQQSNPQLTYHLIPEGGAAFALAFRKESPLTAEANQALASFLSEEGMTALVEKWVVNHDTPS